MRKANGQNKRSDLIQYKVHKRFWWDKYCCYSVVLGRMRLEPVKFRSIQNQRNHSPTTLVFHIKGEMIDNKYLVSAGFDPGTFSTTQARWRRFSQLSHATIYNTFLKYDRVIVEYETWLMNVTSAEWGRYFNVIRSTVRWETAQDCEQCCLSPVVRAGASDLNYAQDLNSRVTE